jgi:hypothetical protein
MTALFIQKCGYYGPRLMKEFGLSAEDAAAILGNLGHESGGFVHMQELGKPRGSGGLGVAQWTGARRHSFEAWCRTHGVSTSSDEGNCGYLIAELHGAESGAIAAVKRTAGLEGKVRGFERVFERAGVPAISRRVTWARLALAALHPGHPASVAPPPRARRKPVADKHRGHH